MRPRPSNFGSTKPFAPPEYGTPPFTLRGGLPYQITFPDFNPGQQSPARDGRQSDQHGGSGMPAARRESGSGASACNGRLRTNLVVEAILRRESRRVVGGANLEPVRFQRPSS